MDLPSTFTVVLTGQIEWADIPGCENAYCEYALVHGDDWEVLDGLEDGVTQTARKSHRPEGGLVWNFPLEVTYKATNAFGWPQLVVRVFEVDALGRDVIKGYGRVHLPIAAGRYVRQLRLYKPLSATLLQTFTSWITGTPATFADPKFPARSDGREVTRVRSSGTLYVQLNLLTKNMGLFGYSEEAGPEGELTASGARLL
mmetsp:Transcript_8269/g.27508  ORF Transcript_8269/g.27508 Transcript_8269/m.27508 type:complete len:200 (+) Transcript_8269:157-756(+)